VLIIYTSQFQPFDESMEKHASSVQKRKKEKETPKLFGPFIGASVSLICGVPGLYRASKNDDLNTTSL
jgi:hypothetical protein